MTTVHRYRDRFGAEHHTIEVPVPAWAWRLAVRAGARRPSLEVLGDQVRECVPTGERVDYWAVTEAPA